MLKRYEATTPHHGTRQDCRAGTERKLHHQDRVRKCMYIQTDLPEGVWRHVLACPQSTSFYFSQAAQAAIALHTHTAATSATLPPQPFCHASGTAKATHSLYHSYMTYKSHTGDSRSKQHEGVLLCGQKRFADSTSWCSYHLSALAATSTETVTKHCYCLL